MRRARNRPPKLESRAPSGATVPAPPPTPEALLERAKVAGPGSGGSGPGPTEFRRNVEQLAAGDRRAFGEIAPISGVTTDDAWAAVKSAFGATPDTALIDTTYTTSATRAAVKRLRDVAAAGGARVAIATSCPASLLTVHLAFADLAREYGAEVIDLADFGPIRADGRTARWLRWIGGVAVVTDTRALCETDDGEVAREWLFATGRPSIVVADGPFAEVAWESGLEVIALVGLDRPALAIAAARLGRCTLVPLRTDRAARSYAVIEDLIAVAEDSSEIDSGLSGAQPDAEV